MACRVFAILFLFFLAENSFAQDAETLKSNSALSDSLNTLLNDKKSSFQDIQGTLTSKIDSIGPAGQIEKKVASLHHKLDSINPLKSNTKYLQKADSLDQVILGKIEKQVTALNQKLDSLYSLKLPGTQYKQKADSLYHGFQEKVLGKFKMPSDTLSPKIKGRINEIDKTIAIAKKLPCSIVCSPPMAWM